MRINVNNFSLEIFDDEGSECTFYTVRVDDSAITETRKFFVKFYNDERLGKSLQTLASLIESIGDRGALPKFFRNERIAAALPSYGNIKIGSIEFEFDDFPLRLYCLRLSDNLVILFNGNEKTSQSAQDGKTSMVFIEANQFAKRIMDALKSEEIMIKNDREIVAYNGSTELIL